MTCRHAAVGARRNADPSHCSRSLCGVAVCARSRAVPLLRTLAWRRWRGTNEPSTTGFMKEFHFLAFSLINVHNYELLLLFLFDTGCCKRSASACRSRSCYTRLFYSSAYIPVAAQNINTSCAGAQLLHCCSACVRFLRSTCTPHTVAESAWTPHSHLLPLEKQSSPTSFSKLPSAALLLSMLQRTQLSLPSATRHQTQLPFPTMALHPTS